MKTSTSVDDYDPAITQHLTLVAAFGRQATIRIALT